MNAHSGNELVVNELPADEAETLDEGAADEDYTANEDDLSVEEATYSEEPAADA
ncbi:MAG: hypothetical protein J5804_01015 [Eggerthellaceae bacterium]|nr:hypothetical protein [Eggerthellaceae bacterium]